MVFEAVELTCPNCGAALSVDMKKCRYCSSPVVIRTVNSFAVPTEGSNQNITAAYGFLKAKLYDKALCAYESAINENFNNADAHFFAAIANLKGKRPFLASPAAIKKSEEYLQTAAAIEEKGIYYYLWAYIRLDHHFRKFYKVTPDYRELYDKAIQLGLSETDSAELFVNLGVSRPPEI